MQMCGPGAQRRRRGPADSVTAARGGARQPGDEIEVDDTGAPMQFEVPGASPAVGRA